MDPLKMLPDKQKSNWPLHLNTVVLEYNVMPYTMTGHQQFEFMFGHKTQMPCDGWLGLSWHDCGECVKEFLG